MTVKSAMNNGSVQNRSALWSPCCGAPGSSASSYDDDSECPQSSEWHCSRNADLTSRTQRTIRAQFSSSDGRRQPLNGCRHCPVDAKQPGRHHCLPVHGGTSELVARGTLPRPAAACTTRQPAVVSHTVHSREIDKPLPQLAVAPPPASSVPRSAPLRRRLIPDALSNTSSSSSSKATQTTGDASSYWQRQRTFHELLASRGGTAAAADDDDDDDAAAFLPRLSRPCSAPRMSAAGRPDPASSEAALVSELVERGRHASHQLDATDVFEMLSRFQSATFPGLRHADFEVGDDRRQTNLLHGSDAAIMPRCSTDHRSSDNDELYDFLADSTEYRGLPSDGVVRWTVADSSVPDEVCQNLDDGEEVLEDEDNGLFSDDDDDDDDGDAVSVSSMSSAVERPPSDEVESRLDGGLQLACPTGRHMTSTPMASVIPACLRDDEEVFPPHHNEMPRRETSSSSPCDDDEDSGENRARESSAPETVATALSKCGDAGVTQKDAAAPADSCALDRQQQRRPVVMYYPPQAYKFYIEQHMENVMKAYEERRRHRAQLETEMDQLRLPDDARTQMRRMLFQKESYHNRLRRTGMDRSAFRPISVLGRGAFADVLLVRKRDSGALYAMKRLRKSDVLRNRQAAHVKAERDILAEADNEWIVRLFYSFQV